MLIYDNSLKVGEARELYFKQTGLTLESYSDRWAKVKVGPVPIYFLNIESRRKSVMIHDIHHVLTGYDTSLLGEAEIKAWEIGSGGGGRYPIFWAFAFFGILIGLFLDPKALYKAYLRGRKSSNLFRGDLTQTILSEKLGTLRTQLRIEEV